MFLSAILYRCFQTGPLVARWPETIAVISQYLVLAKAGPICPLLRPPSPTTHHLSLCSPPAARADDASELMKGKLPAASTEVRIKSRRERFCDFMAALCYTVPLSATRFWCRMGNFRAGKYRPTARSLVRRLA